MFHTIPLSVFPFPSAPCRKRVVSYPIIAFCCRSFNLSIAALPWGRFSFVQPLSLLRRQGRVRHPASASLSLASCWPLPQQLLPVSAALAAVVAVAPLVGEPLAKRLTFPICQSLPSIGEVASRSDDGEVFLQKRGPDKCPALSEVSAYSALVSGFASSALASGFAAGAAGAAGFTTGFGGYGSSFSGKRMIFFGHFWAHIPQPLHLS